VRSSGNLCVDEEYAQGEAGPLRMLLVHTQVSR